jgi:protease IV
VGGFFRGIGQAWKWAAMGIGSLILIILIGTFVFGRFFGPKPIGVPDGVAVRLMLDGPVVEQATTPDPIASLQSGNFSLPNETVLRTLLETIDGAAKDKRVKALTIEPSAFFQALPAHLESISAALKRFKATGKPIYAYGQYYTNSGYFLAAHATDLALDPFGAVAVDGYGGYQPYLKNALDKFDVTVNVFKAGKYKNAVEPYTRADMSPESRESTKTLLDSLWGDYVQTVEVQRKAKGLKLQSAIDDMAAGVQATNGDVAKYAVQAGLVDKLQNREDFRAALEKLVGDGEDDDGTKSFNQIHFADYYAATKSSLPKTGDAVAVVYAAGEIIDGDAPTGFAGGETVARYLRKATEDDDVKAIVLRVDSPGGSVTASEEIRIAASAAQKAGKPLVVSMGSLAASGGYWISAGADEIFALPTTITGSIGAFGILPTIDKVATKYGVNTDGVGTTKFSGQDTLLRPLSEDSKTILQKGIENTYAKFTELVAKGRKLPVSTVDEIGQGRVWPGGMAHQLKLVDRFGDLDDAIKSAAARAKMKDWRVTYLEEPESLKAQLFRMVTGGAVKSSRPKLRMENMVPAKPLLQALTRKGNYILCLECDVLQRVDAQMGIK